MRSPEEIKEQVMLLLVEEINKTNLSEPENTIPKFLQDATNRISELVLDEITYRNRF